MVRALYAGRVRFHAGDGEVAPGVSVHHVGGHTDGLQMVRVETARGPPVLASDASHFYANMQEGLPFPIVFNLGDMAAGWGRARALAEGREEMIVPGHDPRVRVLYPAVEGSAGETHSRCISELPEVGQLVSVLRNDVRAMSGHRATPRLPSPALSDAGRGQIEFLRDPAGEHAHRPACFSRRGGRPDSVRHK